MFGETLKTIMKSRLRRGTAAYALASRVYNTLQPDVQARCYRQYRRDKFVRLTIGDMSCVYEAVSPKNYWHLTIQNDERHPEFGTYLQRDDVVLDIGAHVGAWTVPYAKYVGDAGHVYAFEPEAIGYRAVRRNVELNKLVNVDVLNVAISDFDGTATFYARPDKDTHSLFESTTAPSPLGIQHESTVEVCTIDRLIATGRIRKPDFIKIDVEGAELQVLDGLRSTIGVARAVLVECHEVLRQQWSREPIEVVTDKLAALGAVETTAVDSNHVVGRFRR